MQGNLEDGGWSQVSALRPRLNSGARRDALAKTLYKRLFSWLLKQINVRLSPPREADGVTTIAVVDAFGFEVTPGEGEGQGRPISFQLSPALFACLTCVFAGSS